MIREATLDDVPQLVQLMRMYYEESGIFDGGTFCAEETARMAVQSILQENSFVLVYDKDGIKGTVSTSLVKWFSQDVTAIEDIFYVMDHSARVRVALVLSEYWRDYCIDKGAKYIYTSSTAGFGSAAYNKLMGRIGFKNIKGDFLVYVKV